LSVKDRSPEQLDRNWNELLQELRVAQTGVQILTGFLLTVPFSDRFVDLTDHQRTLYLSVLVGSVVTTALIVAPVSFHRVVFRQHEKDWLVGAGNVVARIGLASLAVVSSSVVLLVFDVAIGTGAGLIAAGIMFMLYVGLWLGVPLLQRE
jgi:MFS family permease